MIGNFVGVLFDGIAYGSLLFLISVGLSVTMGLMNFINLAHGAFAMLGGYVSVALMSREGMPFLLSLPVAFLASAAVGLVLERTLYRRLYKAPHLDQVLFSIGLTFMSVAAATYVWGPQQQPVQLPDWLRGQVSLLGLDVGAYRLFMIAVVIVITLALGWLLYQPAVSTVIVGAKRADQLADNSGACEVEFTADELKQLDKLSRLPREYPGWMLARQGSYRDEKVSPRRIPG